jgi:hypothetical protein
VGRQRRVPDGVRRDPVRLIAHTVTEEDIYAGEEYVLNGALPNTTYRATLEPFLGDSTCAGTLIDLPTATLATYAAGNGTADFVFSRAAVPTFLAGATHGEIFTLTAPDGTVADTTGCTSSLFD